MKRMSSVMLSVALVLSSVFTVNVHAEEQAEEKVNITILATSDVHGFLMPWDYSIDGEISNGSQSQISTAVKEYRENSKNVILVDIGDAIQGNSIDLFSRSEEHPAVKAINYMNYDAWTMGNHEFDFGMEALKKIASKFDGPILAGNLFMTDGSEFAKGYEIIEKDGVRVALIGMTTPMTMEFNKDNDLVKHIDITDPVVETKRVIKELEGKADVLVGVMHMGQDNENNNPNTGVNDIANACPELDVIIAGHMHKNVSRDVVNGVVITEPGVYGRQLSVVDLSFDKNDGQVSLSSVDSKTIDTKDFERDLEFEKLIASEHEAARTDANQIIGKVQGVPMTPANELPGVQYGFLNSTPINRFFNEVQLHYSIADVVSVITELNPKIEGDTIRKKDIAYNYTYVLGETTVYKMTGKDLKTYMEWSADYFNTLKPGDITISFNPVRRASKYSTYDTFGGVTYTIDLTKEYGDRIQNLAYAKNGEPVKDEDEIKVGMNAYRLEPFLKEGGIFEGRTFEILWVSTQELGEYEGTIRGMSIDYIKNVKDGVLVAEDDPNWEVIGIDETSEEYQAVKYLVNNGVISLKASDDGVYKNIESVNGLEKIEAAEAAEIEAKLGITGVYKEDMTRGEFYVAAHKAKISVPVVEEPQAPGISEEVVEPEEETTEEIAEEPKEEAAEETPSEYETIIIKRGDNLWRLSRKYNTTVEELARINNIKNPNLIIAGKDLLVPKSK